MQPDKLDEVIKSAGDQMPEPSATPVQPSRTSVTTDSQREAVANVTRGQIDRIYERDSPYKQFESRSAGNPYERTHAPESQLTAEHLQKYHTAWQDYYQKYYESYYTQAVRQTAEQLRLRNELEKKGKPDAVFSKDAPVHSPKTETPASAVKKLQSSLKEKVNKRAGAVRRSRHFWPLITAVSVAVVFLFLQYNRLLIANVAAFVSPGSVDPQNIIVDPSADTKVGPENKLIIPKINVDAPTDYTVATYDNNTIEAHLKSGVVKYPIPGANALPGQVGNLVIGGHSSNDVFDDGGYKFVFVQLEKLSTGDTFYLNYNSTRYTYHVTKTETIEPNQVTILTQPVTTPTVTLVTCTPVGTALHRFLVFGEQVSPDPTGASKAAGSTSGSNSRSIPGNSPTLIQRLLGQ
jgi:sortase A